MIRAPRKPRQHGTTTMYRAGCHCAPCRAANADYHRERRGYRSNEDRQRDELRKRSCHACGHLFDRAPLVAVECWGTLAFEIVCAACLVRLEPGLAAVLARHPFGGRANLLPAAL